MLGRCEAAARWGGEDVQDLREGVVNEGLQCLCATRWIWDLRFEHHIDKGSATRTVCELYVD